MNRLHRNCSKAHVCCSSIACRLVTSTSRTAASRRRRGRPTARRRCPSESGGADCFDEARYVQSTFATQLAAYLFAVELDESYSSVVGTLLEGRFQIQRSLNQRLPQRASAGRTDFSSERIRPAGCGPRASDGCQRRPTKKTAPMSCVGWTGSGSLAISRRKSIGWTEPWLPVKATRARHGEVRARYSRHAGAISLERFGTS
jgi:hypothetical protein